MQEIAQWLGITIRGSLGHQPYTAVYVPRQNENTPFGLSNCCSHSSKIDLCIKKHGKMMRVRDTPAIVARLKKRDCYACGRIHIEGAAGWMTAERYSSSLVNDSSSGFAVLQELYEFVRSHRFTEQKTLNAMTRRRPEKAKLIKIFNALRHHIDMQIVS
jgi:hypothetical protein